MLSIIGILVGFFLLILVTVVVGAWLIDRFGDAVLLPLAGLILSLLIFGALYAAPDIECDWVSCTSAETTNHE